MSKTGFATFHWPPPDPPEFVPEGWVPLFDAYKLVGKAQFGDEWADGEEMAARSAEEIADPEFERKVLIAAISDLRERARPHFSNKEAEIRARERGDRVWNQLRQWLFAELVPTVILDPLGCLHEVPQNKWAGVAATMILHTGWTGLGGAENGSVLVSHPHLAAAINGEEINEEIDVAATEPVWELPYLEFMQKASETLGLTGGQKFPKDHIETWLRDNWPPELGSFSRRKIESIATLLRRPEDQRGGHFRKDKG